MKTISETPKRAALAPEVPEFQVTLGCVYKSIIAVRVRAATTDEAEKAAREFAEEWCVVDAVPEDAEIAGRGPSANGCPPIDAMFGTRCEEVKTIAVRPAPEKKGLFDLRGLPLDL